MADPLFEPVRARTRAFCTGTLNRGAFCTLLGALLLALSGCQPGDPSSVPRGASRPNHGSFGGDAIGTVLQARSLRVQDGDSFIVQTHAGGRRTIRLSGIDAPERTQGHADQSRQSLRRLLDGRELRIHVAKTDQYGRAVAQVFIAGESAPVDVGLAQIDAGMAWFFGRYQGDLPRASRQRYADAERAARKASTGLWQSENPEPPWDFRRRQRIDGTTR